MYARVTKYKVKHDKIDAARRLLNTMKPQIMAIPGLKQYLNVMDADGDGYVISVVESKAVSDASQAAVGKIWSAFGDLLVEPVVPGGYDVLVNDTN